MGSLRIITLKASIVAGWLAKHLSLTAPNNEQMKIQRSQIEATRWPMQITKTAKNANFKIPTQKLDYRMGCVTRHYNAETKCCPSPYLLKYSLLP